MTALKNTAGDETLHAPWAPSVDTHSRQQRGLRCSVGWKCGVRVEVAKSTAWRWTKLKEKEYAAQPETRGRKKGLTDKKAPRG